MIKDIVQSNSVVGQLQLVLRDSNGNIKFDKTVPNLVVTAGKNVIASRLVGTSSNVMSHMSIGTNSTAPAAAQTSLSGENARVALSSASAAGNVVSYSATFNPGTGTGAIVEAGIFNAGAGGDMLCRTTFLVVNKEAADTLTINWQITIN